MEALRELIRHLPGHIDAAILVVLHVSPDSPSVLPSILDRAGPLRAAHAVDGELLEPGRIYVAPPDCHIAADDGQVRVFPGPRENGHRPAVDVLFRSLAPLGTRATGVVLSGALDDGTAGLLVMRQNGAHALVQDPEESLYAGMPRSAAQHVPVDAVLPVAALAGRLVELMGGDVTDADSGPVEEPASEPTRMTCPDCGGVLHLHRNGDLDRYVCSVGHAYSPASLEAQHGQAVEAALWAATRMLDDRAALLESLGARFGAQHQLAGRYAERAEEARSHAETIRALIERGVLQVQA